jgi:hypothetical protein
VAKKKKKKAAGKRKKATAAKPKKVAAAPELIPVSAIMAGIAKKLSERRPIRWGTGYSDMESISAAGSAGDVRTDLGHPIDLRVPSGYRSQVKKVLEFYSNDPLFGALVRRFWEFGNTRFDWVVPVTDDGKREQAEWEQGFWNYWAAHINSELSHILPGMDSINIGIFKTLLLAGMSPLHWSWGYMTYMGKQVWCPVRLKIENPMSIALVTGRNYGETLAFLKKRISGTDSGNRKRGAPGAGEKYSVKHDMDLMRPEFGGGTDEKSNAGQLRKSKDYVELRYKNSFVLRYEHTPVDARVNRTSGDAYTVAGSPDSDQYNAAYPEVPYISLQEAIQLRRGLAASDMRLIDGIINFMLIWAVGNNDKDAQGRLINLPRPARKDDGGTEIEQSTIATVKDWLETGENMDVAEWVLPYWVKPEILMPDLQALLSSDKYLHATSEILHRFGIFMGEDASNPEIGRMNVLGFEAQLEHIRQSYIARFWEMLAWRVKNHDRNTGTFEAADPNYHWRPLQTRIAEWREEIDKIAKMGAISWQTVWRAMGLSPSAEANRIRRENANGLTDELNNHTPVQFTQSVVNPDGEETEIKDGGTTSRGRPSKMPGGRKKEKS